MSSVQVPSKIVDYSASGIPILHLQQIEGDPCLPYLLSNPDNFIFTNANPSALRDFLNQSFQMKARTISGFRNEEWNA